MHSAFLVVVVVVVFISGNRCPNLDNPANGRVKVSSVNIGGVAVYSCRIGFVLNGNRRRVCQANGHWSGDEPTCEGNLTGD